MNDSALSSDDMKEMLDNKVALIDKAIEKIRQNSVTDLQSLEEDILKFCAALANLPPEDAIRYEPDIARMIARLDVLAEELEAFQERTKKLIDSEEETENFDSSYSGIKT